MVTSKEPKLPYYVSSRTPAPEKAPQASTYPEADRTRNVKLAGGVQELFIFQVAKALGMQPPAELLLLWN